MRLKEELQLAQSFYKRARKQGDKREMRRQAVEIKDISIRMNRLNDMLHSEVK